MIIFDVTLFFIQMEKELGEFYIFIVAYLMNRYLFVCILFITCIRKETWKNIGELVKVCLALTYDSILEKMNNFTLLFQNLLLVQKLLHDRILKLTDDRLKILILILEFFLEIAVEHLK